MRRAAISIAGGVFGFVISWIAVAQPLASAVASTVVTWSASSCPAGVYTITSTAISLATGRTFSVTSTNVQLPKASVTQQFTSLPSGDYRVLAVAARTGGPTFGSAAQTIAADGTGSAFLPRSRPTTREPTGVARPRGGKQIADVSSMVIGSVDWRRFDLIDGDEDGEIDAIRIELTNGRVLTWRIAR